MRTRLLRLSSRLAAALLLGTAALGASSTAAGAGTIVYECKTSSIGCVTFSGYTGKSVWGYPVSSTGNNCTNYVAHRLARNGVAQQSGLGNAGSWAVNARNRGFGVDTTPRTGAVAQWNYGSVYAPSYGHVGYVEEVTSSHITISDSSWSGGSYRWRIPKGDRNWPSNFIHFKDTTYQPPMPGTFVRVRETNEVYRLVGKAPVFVSTWTAFGGSKPTHLVSSTSLASLPRYPADGTFLRGAQRGEVYRVAGGAPVFVSTWTAFGGSKPYTTVDQVAIDSAGTGGRWNHLRATPAEGTFLKGAQRGEVYRVAGGAPVFVSAWANIGGWAPALVVDQVAIDRAGSGTKWNHLMHKPRDGAYIKGRSTGRVYYMKSGVAHFVSSWAQVGGVKPTTIVDQVAIDMAGTRTPVKWSHIAAKTTL
ncbi:CHAP domain-containing protein [Knoellia sp. p5-6-4]|uniref:CHAP domain-containing protein n=1 Tax=unclassified Knoellia TaxID=2618719 RepID=UPI0023DC994F|nr:CHAP domain-containing protein [Knoellia sp. p5-6-4]MDF2143861.1 CHAP domain-containing protein [Knoellia sp. p5-6-4]